MRRRILTILCLVLLAVSVAIPALTGDSPWRLRGGRVRRAEEAVAGLAAPRVADRDAAERALSALGPAALPVLDDLPGDAPAETRLRAHRAAASIRTRAAVRPEPALDRLERALARGERPSVELLETLGARALPLLRTATARHRDDPDLLRLLVERAAVAGGPEADRILGAVLAAGDVPAALVHRAAEALAEPDATIDVRTLRLLVKDPWSARRAAAIRVLLAHGAGLEPEEVRRAVADPSPFVRRACAPLLADARTRHAAIALLGDPDARVRLGAVEALQGVTDPDSMAAVRDRLRDDHARVRAAAVDCLAAAGKTEGLRALASDSSCGVRLAVHRAVGMP